MEVICLSGKAPEAIGPIIKEFLRPEIKALFFGDNATDGQVASLFFFPTTVIYGLYRESQSEPVGVLFFCNVEQGANASVYLFFFSEASKKQGINIAVCDFVKKDLIEKCPTLNSLEAVVANGDPPLEKILVEMGFERVGIKKGYRKFGGKDIDIISYYCKL